MSLCSSRACFFLWWLDMNESIELVLRWWHILRSSIFNIVFNFFFFFHQCQIDVARSTDQFICLQVAVFINSELRYCQGKEKTGGGGEEEEKENKWKFVCEFSHSLSRLVSAICEDEKKKAKERRWWRRKVQTDRRSRQDPSMRDSMARGIIQLSPNILEV